MNNISSINIPKHVAIIMDGNARWAKLNNLNIVDGHEKGVRNIKKIASACIDKNIKYLTLYAFSNENWQRSKSEISNLFTLLNKYLDNDVKYLQDYDIKLNVIGDLSKVDSAIVEKIKIIENKTSNNKKLNLSIALSYGSRQEILNAFLKIFSELNSKQISIDKIDADYITQKMYNNYPEPDLLIRTGSEKRLSNFLLWQIAYTELCFIDNYWPDFSENILDDCINEYNKRIRRYGKR